jgi:predicted glycoside hydrolase/deacetylase ChbG (UPF0249 family)
MTTPAARSRILERAGGDVSVLHAELSAQIERALLDGLDVTHVDSHMYVLYHAALLPTYARVALQYRVPACAPPWLADVVARMDECGRAAVVTFDGWVGFPLSESERHWDSVKKLIDGLPPGLSYCISHPARDSEELRAVAFDWRGRVADHHVLADPRWVPALEAAGVKVLGMRAIRDVIFPEPRVLLAPARPPSRACTTVAGDNARDAS